MKNTSLILATLLLGLPFTSNAQVDLGSNGSYGPLEITASTTLTVPEDGIFHCTTISITGGNGVGVTFTRNNRNTPVYLLATGDVVIDAVIALDGGPNNGGIPGSPGPGGYGGGQGVSGNQAVPDGYGPGGGRGGDDNTGSAALNGGSGAYGTRNGTYTKNGSIYGNPILIPLVGGSGGGGAGAYAGGGGGGAILIGSNTKITLNASTDIYARGGNGARYNHGSGGAIRLVAPDISSNGSINLITADKYNEAYGRVRIDAMRRSINSMSIYAEFSIGSNMVIFPPNMPDLKIVEAAGQAVNPNQATPLLVTVPPGAPAIQPVKVRAQNFGGTAPVTVVLTPEFGAKTSFNLDIPNPGPAAAEASVDVTFPINVTTRVDVWTR